MVEKKAVCKLGKKKKKKDIRHTIENPQNKQKETMYFSFSRRTWIESVIVS